MYRCVNIKILQLSSLRGRYSLLSALLIAFILLAMIVANSYVTQLRHLTTSHIGDRKQLLMNSRQIRDSAWQTRQLLASFLLDPYRGEYRNPVHVEMERTRRNLEQLQELAHDIIPNQLPVISDIRATMETLDVAIEKIITTRLNALTQYPSMALAQENMQPLNQTFFTAVTLALDETDTQDARRPKSEAYMTLLRARHLWTQMISNFRIYLANRMGSFREDTLLTQEQDVTALHAQLMVEIDHLQELQRQHQLGIQTEDSIAILQSASEQWLDNFRRVLWLHSSDAWRADAKQLKESIEPLFANIWNGLITIDASIEAGSDSDIATLTVATNTQENIFWSVTALCILFIVGAYVALDRAVLTPLSRVSRALNAEANGEILEPLAVSGVSETQELLNAFDSMRVQVHTRRSELEYQTLHDQLTGLPNRAMLENMLSHNIAAAQASTQSFALLMIDLDRFKEVNDTLGHSIGDKLLQTIAQRLSAMSRHEENVARFGGDEFCMVIPNTTELAAGEVADLVIKQLDRVIEVDHHQLLVGASVGIALYPQNGEDVQTLMQHADVAMYEAKRNRAGHAFYNPVSDQHSVRQLSLVGELREAIESGSLELHYQPKLAIATSQFVGVEALLRWTHPTHGRISPDQIIPMAEQTGLIRPLTRWVLDTALRQCEMWRQNGMNISVAVNLSANCILDQQLMDWINQWFTRNALPPSRLVLEVTESAMMADPVKSIEVLTRFADKGISISVDDYGTGFSSLAYLKRLPIKEIKIDRSFVMEMLDDESNAVIVRSTIELAHNLGMHVVAEGVENQEILNLLAMLGCDYAQGYHISRPVSAADLQQWWKTTYPQFVAAQPPPARPVPVPVPKLAPLRLMHR